MRRVTSFDGSLVQPKKFQNNNDDDDSTDDVENRVHGKLLLLATKAGSVPAAHYRQKCDGTLRLTNDT